MSTIITTIRIGFEEVQKGDPKRVAEIFEGLLDLPGEGGRNGVSLSVSGYESDPRELCEIPEVRAYFRKLWDQVPGLLYWLDIGGGMLFFMATMLHTPTRVAGGTTIDPHDFIDFVKTGFLRLNAYCDANAISADPTSYEVRDFLQKAIPPAGR